MTTYDEVYAAIDQLAAMKFFPRESNARATIARLIKDFATSVDQVRWLTRRMLVLYDAWPGPREMRALFCSRWKPRDGIEATSSVYLEGFPPERKAEPKVLIAPEAISADPRLARAVIDLAEKKDMNRRKP